MLTLLQNLLLQALPFDPEPVLLAYIKEVLPAVEQEFAVDSVVEKSKISWAIQSRTVSTEHQISYESRDSEQNLLIYILNSLLIGWNLLPLLGGELALSLEEKRLLCLSFTFYGYNVLNQGEGIASLTSSETVLSGKKYLDIFWPKWCDYLPAIGYLTQIPKCNPREDTLLNRGSNCKIPESRLKLPLRQLISFGTIAAQLTSPADIVMKPEGDSLRALLKELGIDRTLRYHRLRNCTGLLTNSIHNAVLDFAKQLNWQPILFFPDGIVYLAPPTSKLPELTELQEYIWKQLSSTLTTKMLTGETGFERDSKGLKVAPQTLEFLSPSQLIRNLSSVVVTTVRNETTPATPKRLKRLALSPTEREFLARGEDLRSDRIAEFIILLQKELFGNNPEFINQVLGQLGIQSAIDPEQTQVSSGGVNWGWYHAAAYYVASNPNLDAASITGKLQEIANYLATWAEEKNLLLLSQTSPTRQILDCYLSQYLEIPGWDNPKPSFQEELAAYVMAKTKAARQPICSLSSGEFASEDQMVSVVFFKAQQYSNKNPLGGRRLKRGISKIWSLEMLLRRAFWPILPNKLEEGQPVFLYLLPNCVQAPQMGKATYFLVTRFKRINLWEIRRFWQEQGMDANALRFYPWLKNDSKPNNEDRQDLSFLAVIPITTSGKTTTDAWIEPAFLAIALPLLLGIKVVATPSPIPPCNEISKFSATLQVDGPAIFWNRLGLPNAICMEEEVQGQINHLSDWLNRLLIAYSIHLDCRADPPDPRWQAFSSTVQAIMMDILAIFSLACSHFQSLSNNKVQQYWKFAQIWVAGDPDMEEKLELTQRLVQEYRIFYRVHPAKSSYAIVLPLSKVLEDILSVPVDLQIETLILQTSGQLHKALRRQEPYERPLIMDKSLSFEVRVNNEIQAINQFVTTCINDLFLGQYKGDRVLLRQNRHKIKAGAEFAYHLLAMQEPNSNAEDEEVEEAEL